MLVQELKSVVPLYLHGPHCYSPDYVIFMRSTRYAEQNWGIALISMSEEKLAVT